MSKFKLVFDGEELDEVFSTRKAAEEYGLYLQGCESVGMEELSWSNPGRSPV